MLGVSFNAHCQVRRNALCSVVCAVVYLDSGLVKLDVVKSLLVSGQLALQFVHTDRFLSECVQLVSVGPSRPCVRQQLVALQELTAKNKSMNMWICICLKKELHEHRRKQLYKHELRKQKKLQMFLEISGL